MIGTAARLVRLAMYRLLAPLAILIVLPALLAVPAFALKPITVSPEQERIEVTMLGELYEQRGDNLQLETAAGADGLAGRMAVRASTPGTNPSWMVFALTNTTDKPLERWLTAERYTVVGSGIIWPDLDARRIEAVTPSIGFVPERIKSDRADIFRVTLDPGQTITYVAELSSERFARIYLWKPLDYELKARDRQLFNGILLGLLGLLAIFLTSVFAANHKAIFPTAALVAWCVLGYLCVDFGFFHKLFQLRPEGNAVYRAATESAMAASLVIFLHTYLRLGAWHGFIRMLVGAWIVAQLGLVAVAVIDPRLASTFARLSFIAIGGIGMLFTLFLALRGQDRALALVPTWLLMLVWIFAAAVILTGRLSGDIFVSGLVAGLVLIIVLLGFTVTQFAFRALEPIHGVTPSELQLRSLAVDGSHAAIWQWNARRDELKISSHVETSLGLQSGSLSASVDDFLGHVHQADRERFRLTLWSLQERNGGNIHVEFRLRHADSTFRWFEVEAASAPASERRQLRCIGLMRDITDARRAQERLLHDAVYDSLTGLPNRELFADRLSVAVQRAIGEPASQPTVMFIDLDRFRSVNTDLGLVMGDSVLLTIARRLQRHLGPQDTLARVGGDQFAVLLLGQTDARELAQLAERIRRSLRSPINISGQEIVLTGTVGLAIHEQGANVANDLLKDAEIAMHRAKRQGADRIEIFRAEMRADQEDRVAILEDLKRAIDKSQIRILYQPIIYLPTEELAGFETVVRWEHPKLGLVDPATLVDEEETGELAVRLGSQILTRAAQDVARWHKELARPDRPLFVSVGITSRKLFRKDLIQEIRHILGRSVAPQGALRIAVAEGLVLDNPEQASEILEWLRGAGAELCLEEFGSGYTSLAYLQRFPFDTIRIDRMLVQMSAPDGRGSPLVRAIVALAHELGRKVIADGVETPEDVAFLRSLGCEYAQGFYYGEPMADRDVVQSLKIIRKSERKLQRRGFFRTKAKPAPVRVPDGGLPAPATQAPPSPAERAAAAGATNGRAAARKPKLAPGMTVRSRRPGTSGAQSGAQSGADAALVPDTAAAMSPAARLPNRMSNGAPNGTYPLPPTRQPALPAAAAMVHAAAANGSATDWQSQEPTTTYVANGDLYAHASMHEAELAPHVVAAHPGESASTLHSGAVASSAYVPSDAIAAAAHPIVVTDAAAGLGAPDGLPPAQSLSDALANAARNTSEAATAPALDAPAAHVDPTPARALPPFSAALPPAGNGIGAAPPPDASRGRAVSDMPELKTLPPAIAASLARLAGVPLGSKPVTPAAPPARKRQDAGE